MALSRAGVPTAYPRAIYMTGHWAGPKRPIADPRGYNLLAHLRTPDGQPAVTPDHLLLSVRPDQTLVLDRSGRPEFRLCNFELMRGPLPGVSGPPVG